MSRFQLGGITEYNAPLETAALEASVVEFLKWGLLECGAFQTVDASSKFARLRPAEDPNYPSAGGTARVWEGRRADWVWEAGTDYPVQPTRATGATVNGAAPTGAYAVDYPRGRLVFDNALPTGSVVVAPHSHRLVQVRRTDEPWWHEIDVNSNDPDDPRFAAAPGARGELELLTENRVQLPCWVVEPVWDVTTRPFELGSDRVWLFTTFLFHCLAETPWERKWLVDALVAHADRPVPTFDPAVAPPPLSAFGTLETSPKTFKELCQEYPWRTVWVDRVRASEGGRSGRLYWATVRWTLRVTPGR